MSINSASALTDSVDRAVRLVQLYEACAAAVDAVVADQLTAEPIRLHLNAKKRAASTAATAAVALELGLRKGLSVSEQDTARVLAACRELTEQTDPLLAQLLVILRSKRIEDTATTENESDQSAIAALRRVWPQDARPQRRVAAAAPLPSAARKVYPAPVAAAVSAGTGGAAASSEFTAPALATAAAAMLPATAASATIAPSSNTAPETDEQLGYGKSQRLEPSVDVPFTEIRVDRPHLVGNQLFGHVAYHCRGALGEEGTYEAVRRYTDFLELRRAIVRKCPDVAQWLPRLPDKALLGKFKAELWASRTQGLNSFLLVLKEKQAQYPILCRFLHRFFTI